ncbi:hypothetical protein [Selenomonas sputigena]|nr:hypothetical protein [Selenomonas sputigena]
MAEEKEMDDMLLQDEPEVTDTQEGTDSTREILKRKLREHFDGKIVRKDLTKK